jgi:hypothetical protein
MEHGMRYSVNRGSDDQRALGFLTFEAAEETARAMSMTSPLGTSYINMVSDGQWLCTYVKGRLKRCDLSAIADAMAGQ